jgi:hypothetical protein
MPGLSWVRGPGLAFSVSRILLVLGAAIRLLEYARNRPFSIDESFLGLNVIEKSPVQLLHELDFNQAAPLGFLEGEKLAISVLGRSEYGLRLLPLLASLAALLFFYRAAQRLLPTAALPVACAAFALLDPTIYYGATAKQYSLDVAVTVILYSIAARPRTGSPARAAIELSAAGVLAVWFSHASAFILGAIGITLGISAIARRKWNELALTGMAAATWLISLGIELHLSESNLSRIQQSFNGGRVLLTTGRGGTTWFDSATAKVRYLVGLEDTATGFPVLGSLPAGVNQGLTVLLCLVVGLGFLAFVKRRSMLALLVSIPPVLVLFASALHKYPLVGRTLLFLLPSVALCLAEGVRVLTARRRTLVFGGLFGATALAAIGLLPAIHLAQPRASEGIRPALRELGRRQERGDTLYVGHLAQYGFVYYHLCDCAGFDPADVWPFELTGGPSGAAPALIPRTKRLVIGVVNLPQGNYRPDVRALVGRRRAWVLVSEIPDYQLRPFITALRRNGRQLRKTGPYGVAGSAASLYLFDLKRGLRR